MKLNFFCIFTLLTLAACNSDRSKGVKTPPKVSESEQLLINKMRWVDTKDPIKSAKQDVISGNCTFIAGTNRKTIYFSGLNPDESKKVIAMREYKIAEGMHDIIRGATHKKYRAKVKEYASTYNRYIFDNCF